ncbi:hypothetical protein NC652_041578 [Populus alba x Populus x berolinensis]|nr:hypothetical protein NC652_041578 [Populus alba x Populus x berolinensis]
MLNAVNVWSYRGLGRAFRRMGKFQCLLRALLAAFLQKTFLFAVLHLNNLLLMLSCFVRSRRNRAFQTEKSGHEDRLFCQNLSIALYEFTMEKLLFVLRSPKVINLESVLHVYKAIFKADLWALERHGVSTHLR